MKATLRNSRNGNAKHNDRDFNLEHERNDGHIDPDRQDKNIYWHCYHESEPQLSFYEAEKKYYKEHYIMTKREDTTRSSIVLSIISMNLDSLLRLSLFQKLILIYSRYNCCYILCESVG